MKEVKIILILVIEILNLSEIYFKNYILNLIYSQ